MIRKPLASICLLLSALLIASGCATTPETLPPNELSRISDNNKILVFISAINNNLNVLDHIGPSDQNHDDLIMQQIITGGIVGYAVASSYATSKLAAERFSNKRKSLGGNPQRLSQELEKSPVDIQEALIKSLDQRLSQKFNIIMLDGSKEGQIKSKAGNDLNFKNYKSYAKRNGVDTILKINFVYGLATYRNERASAAVDADVSVYNTQTDKVVMKKTLSSETYFRNSQSIEEFAKDGGLLFREDIIRAADGLSLRIATVFGIYTIETESAKLGFHGSINNPANICIRPYQFHQDCAEVTGPSRVIHIADHEATIAGSNDGKEIILEKLYALSDSPDSSVDKVISTDNKSMSLMGYRAIKYELLSRKIMILREFKVLDNQRLKGFILELDADGYSILKDYTVKKFTAGNTETDLTK